MTNRIRNKPVEVDVKVKPAKPVARPKPQGKKASNRTRTQARNRRNKNRQPQQQHDKPKFKPSDSGMQQIERERYDGMAKYLYGMCDPANPGRGPSKSSQPTILLSYDLTQVITPTAYSNTWNPYITNNSAGGFIDPAHPYMLTSNGDIGIIVSPQPDWIADAHSTTAMPAWGLTSGATFDPGLHISRMEGFTINEDDPSDFSKPYPLKRFPSLLPLAPASPNDASMGLTPSQWRTVGLRTTIRITAPAMTAQGDVRAGDNRDFEATMPRVMIDTNGAPMFQEDVVQAGALNSPLFQAGVSIAPVGAFTHGATYEAVWMPGSDLALQYTDPTPRLSYIQSTIDGSTLKYYQNNNVFAGALLNSPCNIFILQGVPVGSSITMQTTWSVEMPIIPGSTVGFLWREARLAATFVPDWRELLCHNAGGKPGDAARCFMRCNYGKRGYDFAVRNQQSPGTRDNMNTGQGPTPATTILQKLFGAGKLAAKFAGKGVARAALASVVGPAAYAL